MKYKIDDKVVINKEIWDIYIKGHLKEAHVPYIMTIHGYCEQKRSGCVMYEMKEAYGCGNGPIEINEAYVEGLYNPIKTRFEILDL